MRSILIYGLGEAVGKLALLAALPLYGRFLSVGDFGTVTILFPMVQLLQNTFGLGLSVGILKYYYDRSADRDTLYWNVLALWGTIIGPSAILILVASRFTSLGAYNVGLHPFSSLATAFVVAVLGLAVSQFAAQMYRASRAPFRFVLLNAGWRTAMVGAVAVYLVLSPLRSAVGVFWVIASVLGGTGCLSAIVLLRRATPRLDIGLWKGLLGLGTPLVIGGITSYLLMTGGRLVVNEFMPAEGVGVYGMAFSVAQAMSLVIATFSRINGPEIFRQLHEARFTGRFLDGATDLVNHLLMLVAFTIAALGHPILSVIGHSDYQAGLPLLPPLLFSFLIQGVYIASVDVLYYRRKTGLVTAISIFAGTASIGLAVLFVPRWGLAGAAAAQVATMLVQSALVSLATARLEGLRLPWLRWATTYLFAAFGLYTIVLYPSLILKLALLAVGIGAFLLSIHRNRAIMHAYAHS